MAALLKVHDIKKHYPVRKGFGSKGASLKALDGVSVSVEENRVLGIVGESGSGKSTLARIMLALLKPDSGSVEFEGRNVFGLSGKELKAFRRAVQIVFQDPFASLNPRVTVFDAISEPLKIHGLAASGQIKDKVVSLLSEVGLGPETLERYPHEFSGGQRQRICIARALAVSPRLIVADEPLSALDVSIQAQIINILAGLKARTGMSYVFISHDLRVVEYLSDEVAVMYLGRVVEHAGAEQLFAGPLHPYTVGLLASAPGLDPSHKSLRQAPKGDVPSPIDIPPGCPFHPRCPRRFEPCDRVFPKLEQPSGHPGTIVACHLWNPH